MGKNVKKKARGCQKEKRPSSSSSKPTALPQQNNLNAEGVANGGPVDIKKRACVHLDKAVDLAKVSSKIESAVSIGCEDCREGAIDRRAGKGKGKHTKKKGGADSKATWVCLQCGHFTCGGIGLPTTPQSHAIRHSSQCRHPLVIQVENPHLRWCFSCSMLIPVDKLEDTGEHKDVLSDIVKLLKKQSSKESSVDMEDIWFGNGSASSVSELKLDNKEVVVVNGKHFYAVRGLVNLGNTCFFNSVLQNLLAMDILREYLQKYDGSMGPLTSSLKKIFAETNPGTGLRNVISPKPLFGCICAKAPQFRGYQQQDSHELLHYLLDGLSTEMVFARKQDQSSLENGESKPVSSTFIDAIFGGQLSSTVCCIECGHSSVVYEPFLDLSLPVPTKTPPPKRASPNSRTKKTKVPPKRSARTRPKHNKDGESVPIMSGCNPSPSNDSSSALNGDYLSCSSSGKLVEPENLVTGTGGISQNYCNSTEQECSSLLVSQFGEYKSEKVPDCMSWLDYLEPVPLLDDQNSSVADCLSWLDFLDPVPLLEGQNYSARNENLPVSHDSSIKEAVWHAAEDTSNTSAHLISQHTSANPSSKSVVGDLGQNSSVQVQDNQILLLTFKEDSVGTTEGINVDVTSSSVVSAGEDSLGFDGLGDMFNEPEVDVPSSSVTSGCQARENLSNGPAGNSSESDVNEVDNTDSPVSIKSCLAHFIKPEILSGEHAWHCENCSKLLKEKRRMVKKHQCKTSSVSQMNVSNDEYSNFEVLQVSSHPSQNDCNDVDENVKNLDAVQINGLCLTSVQETQECSKTDENSNNGSRDLDENLKKFDTVRINAPCLKTVTSVQEREGCSKQETMHLHTPSPSNFVRPSDESTCGKSINLNGVSDNDVPFETLSELDGEGNSEIEDVDSKCAKVKRDATKRILINKAPPILTIHLKRFSQDSRGRLSKLNGYVGFKEYIDLGPYLDSRSADLDSHIYRLIGVVEHSGSMRGGHYITYVRGGDRSRGRLEENRHGNSVWYYASDAIVRETTLDEVLRCEAYLLFYENVKP